MEQLVVQSMTCCKKVIQIISFNENGLWKLLNATQFRSRALQTHEYFVYTRFQLRAIARETCLLYLREILTWIVTIIIVIISSGIVEPTYLIHFIPALVKFTPYYFGEGCNLCLGVLKKRLVWIFRKGFFIVLNSGNVWI